MSSGSSDRLLRILSSPLVSFGATEASLEGLMAELGYRLPDDYLDFMRQSNGYTGEVGTANFVNIWRVEEVMPTNRANNFSRWIPGLALFASNESGDFYAFDMRHGSEGVVFIPSIPLDLRYARKVGLSFTDFLERLAGDTGCRS